MVFNIFKGMTAFVVVTLSWRCMVLFNQCWVIMPESHTHTHTHTQTASSLILLYYMFDDLQLNAYDAYFKQNIIHFGGTWHCVPCTKISMKLPSVSEIDLHLTQMCVYEVNIYSISLPNICQDSFISEICFP